MLSNKVKRFFKTAEARAEGSLFRVVLDERPIRTPEGSDLVFPTLALATHVAEEWSEQEDEIKPLTMPIMRLACTAVDKVAPVREQVIDQLVRYGESDLVCYRSTEPDDLIALQNETWQPVLDWLDHSHGIKLNVTHGIVHVAQPQDALVRLAKRIAVYNDFELAGLGELTQLTGSLALALACMSGELSGDAVFLASQLDDDWQADKWGEDSEAVERRKNLQADISAAVQFIEKLGGVTADHAGER